MKKSYLFLDEKLIRGSVMSTSNESPNNTSINIDKKQYISNGLNVVDTSNDISAICIQECFYIILINL